MKVLFFTQGKNMPSSRFRVHQFLPGLKAAGIDCEVLAPYPSVHGDIDSFPLRGIWRELTRPFSVPSRLRQLSRVHDFDLIYVQKPLLRYGTIACETYVSNRKPFLFDLDDALFHNGFGLAGVQIKKIGRLARGIVAGNSYISDFFGMPEKTTIIPTVIDTSRYSPRVDSGGQFTLGWTGSRSNLKELRIMESSLKKVLKKTNGKLIIICEGSLPSWLSIPEVEHIPWSPQSEVEGLSRVHVGLMPLRDTKYNRGKCGFKLIQCMARAIPVVTTPLEVNKQIVRNGVDGFWAQSESEWESALFQLYESQDERVRMGLKARERISENYSIEAALPKMINVFKNALSVDEKFRQVG